MATNWNVKQAYVAINEGNKEAIIDIGRRFPLTLNILSKIDGKNPAVNLINALPEHITVRKIEQILKGDVEEGEEVEAAETTKEVVSKTAEAKTETEEAENDYSNMNATQLSNMLKDAGVYKDCIKKMGGAKKQQMLAYIEKYGVEPVEEEPVEEEAVEEDPYEGKTAVELFKECKARGIKAAPKKPAKFYIDLLKKADEEAKSEEEEDDDDWDEEEEPAKPVKPAKKQKPAKEEKKVAKKAAKEEDEDEDDDDDWNI